MKPLHLKIAYLIAGLILLAYMGIILFGDNGWQTLNAMKQKEAILNAENDELWEKNTKMRREIFRLKNDPEFIEKIIREELKMIKRDEVVFKFLDDEKGQKK